MLFFYITDYSLVLCAKSPSNETHIDLANTNLYAMSRSAVTINEVRRYENY